VKGVYVTLGEARLSSGGSYKEKSYPWMGRPKKNKSEKNKKTNCVRSSTVKKKLSTGTKKKKKKKKKINCERNQRGWRKNGHTTGANNPRGIPGSNGYSCRTRPQNWVA